MTGIIRLPTDLTENFAADADVTYTGQGDIFATAAFYQKYGASVGNFPGIVVPAQAAARRACRRSRPR